MDKIEFLAMAIHSAFVQQGGYVTDLPTQQEYDNRNELLARKMTTIDGKFDLRKVAVIIASALEDRPA